MGEAYITRRGGTSKASKSGVSGVSARTSTRAISIPDLAGKTCFAIVARGYSVLGAADSEMVVNAIYYNNGSYSVSLISAADCFEFTESDDFDILTFDSATGAITLKDALSETIMFENCDYHYVGW